MSAFALLCLKFCYVVWLFIFFWTVYDKFWNFYCHRMKNYWILPPFYYFCIQHLQVFVAYFKIQLKFSNFIHIWVTHPLVSRMCTISVLIIDLVSLSLSRTHSVGASDTVSSHGDYNSLLDESCETLPEGSLGQVPAAAIPPTTTTTHGNHCAFVPQDSYSVKF